MMRYLKTNAHDIIKLAHCTMSFVHNIMHTNQYIHVMAYEQVE